MTHFIGHSKGLHGLACHLPDTLSGNHTQTFSLFGKMLCNFHHIAAHDNRQLLMRALLVDVELDVCEIDYV